MRLDTTKKDHYDIMAAIRGPDGDDYFMDKCKTLFTARIRYWVGCGFYAGTVRSPGTDDACIQLVLDSTPDEMPDWWRHYRGHVRDALWALLRVSPRSLQDFSSGEAERLIEATDEISASFVQVQVEGEEELPF